MLGGHRHIPIALILGLQPHLVDAVGLICHVFCMCDADIKNQCPDSGMLLVLITSTEKALKAFVRIDGEGVLRVDDLASICHPIPRSNHYISIAPPHPSISFVVLPPCSSYSSSGFF